MFKKANVVMLTTNNKHSGLDIDPQNNNKLSIESIRYFHKNPQHLYITSDEEIKEGDWFVYDDIKDRTIHQASNYKDGRYRDLEGNIFIEERCDKIIASTNAFLNKTVGNISYNIPQPSPQFIQKYIEEYNKSNVITEVMVEYEEQVSALIGNEIETILKVNSKDNTITIKKIKDSWSREELSIFKDMNNHNFIEWIYDRMICVHNENPMYDYMLKLKSISDFINTI